MQRKEGREVKTMKSRCKQEWADLRYSEIDGSGTYEKGKVYTLKDRVYIHIDKLPIQERHSLFNNQEFLLKTFWALSFLRDPSNEDPLISSRQVNSYLCYFNMPIEEAVPFPCVNRTAWKQGQQILTAFLFHGCSIWCNTFQLIWKLTLSPLDSDVPCANAYFATDPPQYFYGSTSRTATKITHLSFKSLQVIGHCKYHNRQLPWFLFPSIFKKSFGPLLEKKSKFFCKSGLSFAFDSGLWEGMRSKKGLKTFIPIAHK